MLYFNTNVGATLVGKKSPFPLASPDSRSVLAVKGSLRRFAPWTAAGRSGETRCSDQRAYLNRMLRLETEPALANATFCALPA